MSPSELHKRVADVLGVSASQKNLAFEVLTESIAEILTDGITLKIPRIGFFQLKPDSQKSNSAKQLMFSSLPEDFDPSEKILYHTFDVSNKYKNSYEMDSQVFSIGVGKPLLPLHDEESTHDSETSFVMLRKSIEERVKEVLAESDQIPNFNIWEDIYSNSDEALNLDTDFSSKLLELTKDLHLTEDDNRVEPEIEPQHRNFLNSLMYSDKPEASEEFFAEEKPETDSLIEITAERNFIDEELYKIDETETGKNLSVTDLLGEMDWMQKVDMTDANTEEDKTHELETVEPVAQEEEQIDITIPDSFTNQQKIDVIENPIESPNEKNDFSSEDQIGLIQKWEEREQEQEQEQELIEQLSLDGYLKNSSDDLLANLLSDDEVTEVEQDTREIVVEPPSSAKELLIQSNLEANEESINAWAIEEEDLKGIINEELREYDHEKIANDNSRVLNDLLEDAFHRKVETDSTGEFDEEIFTDEPVEGNTASERIEWSWGDELKEEFGIGAQDEEVENLQDSLLNMIAEEDIPKPVEPQFDLAKTRQDLFSRLEKTLEREVTSLRDNYDNPTETKTGNLTSEKISYTEPKTKAKTKVEIVEEETQPVVEFKDEKVYLDFKTPPPRYEFIEEPTQSSIQDDFPEDPIVLTKPKRMTILLERNEPEEVVSNIEEQKEEVTEQKPKSQKSGVTYLLIITVALLVVVVSIVGYLYFIDGASVKEEAKQQNPVENKNDNAANVQDYPNNTVSREALGLNPDDFSEFPTTATPPAPVKEGGSVDISRLTENKNLPKNEEILRQSQKEDLAKKTSTVQNKKPASGETRLADMIFSDGRTYNFQISSWKNKMLAESEVNRLRSQGFNAFLVEAYLPDKGGTWYRIRIGSFKSEQEALEFKRKNSF